MGSPRPRISRKIGTLAASVRTSFGLVLPGGSVPARSPSRGTDRYPCPAGASRRLPSMRKSGRSFGMGGTLRLDESTGPNTVRSCGRGAVPPHHSHRHPMQTAGVPVPSLPQAPTGGGGGLRKRRDSPSNPRVRTNSRGQAPENRVPPASPGRCYRSPNRPRRGSPPEREADPATYEDAKPVPVTGLLFLTCQWTARIMISSTPRPPNRLHAQAMHDYQPQSPLAR